MLLLTPPNEKSLVFSQFTSFLDKIAETLEERGISFVRFDGQMSQKRRQDTIARFSVPLADELGDDDGEVAPVISSRRRGTRKIVVDTDDFDADDGDDFVMPANGSDTDDFLDDEDDASAFATKSKGKGKAKAKPKSNSRSAASDGENPQVMIISLKAARFLQLFLNLIISYASSSFRQGALGLNLTGKYHEHPFLRYSD